MGEREPVLCLIPPEMHSPGFVKHWDLCVSAKSARLLSLGCDSWIAVRCPTHLEKQPLMVLVKDGCAMRYAMELTRLCGEPGCHSALSYIWCSFSVADSRKRWWSLYVARWAVGEMVKEAVERQSAFCMHINTLKQHLENCLGKNKQIFIYKFCVLVFKAFLWCT